MKKPLIKGILSLTMATMMSITMISCGAKTKDIESMTIKDVSFPLEETVTLKMLTHAPAISEQDPSKRAIFQRLEEETNVKIDWTCYVDDQFGDKKNLALSKKETLPDLVFDADMSTYDLLRYAKQGVIIPVEDLIDKYMPNLSEILEKKPDYRKMITAPDGHIYSFPWLEELGTGKEAIQAVSDIPYINKKWLEQLGLEIPNTIEELESVLKAFKENIPDSIPMSFILNNGSEDPCALLGAFGYGDNGDHYIVTNDKEVIYSTVQEGYKEGVEWLHSLQEAGLIDAEAFTQDWSTYVNKGKNDKYGLFFSWDSANIVSNFEDYVPLPALSRQGGEKNVTRWNSYGVQIGRSVITTANKNLELTAKWVDKLYEPLQSIQDNWGTYGEENKQNIFELKEEGTLAHLDLEGNSPWETRANQYVGGPLAILDEYYGVYTTCPEDAQIRLDVLHSNYVDYMEADYTYPLVFMSIEDTELLTQYETAIRGYTDRKRAEWILNGGIEEEWNAYLEEMEKLGLSKALEIKQKYFDEYYK